jgi:photosystem II stability/assembly factor-like uncharacterized protein
VPGNSDRDSAAPTFAEIFSGGRRQFASTRLHSTLRVWATGGGSSPLRPNSRVSGNPQNPLRNSKTLHAIAPTQENANYEITKPPPRKGLQLNGYLTTIILSKIDTNMTNPIFQIFPCRTLCFFILIIFLQPTTTQAQWVKTKWENFGRVSYLVATDTQIYAGIWDNGVFRSSDNGETWVPINSESKYLLYNTGLAIIGRNLFASTHGNGVFRTTDSGQNWISAPIIARDNMSPYPFKSECGIIDFISQSDNILFAGAYRCGLFKSSDFGASWITLDSNLHQASSGFGIGDISLTVDAVGNIPDGYNLKRTSDNGAHWTIVNFDSIVDPRALMINGAVTIGTDIFIGSGSYGVLRSSDSGASWIAVNNGLTHTNLQHIALWDSILFAEFGSYGSFASSDKGNTWVALDSGRTGPTITTFAASSKYIFVGAADSTIWRYQWSEMGSTNNLSGNQFSGVYFSRSLKSTIHPGDKIEFTIDHSAIVNISVYDIRGRKVKTVLNSLMSAGNQSATIGALELDEGMYFLRLQINKVSRTQRFVFTR